METDPGILVLVATPIGNLGDLSPRASRILQDADAVLAEDTRRTRKLLDNPRKLLSYNDHNAAGRLPEMGKLLMQGKTVAVVSDAGTPGISDPAYRAVRKALEVGAIVTVIPGPTAVIAALVGSGLPVDRFCFEGFLPRKKGARRKRLEEAGRYPGTLIFFIGPHHLSRYLFEMYEVLGDRPACVARELTKLHEEYVRGALGELATIYSECSVRGEITLLVGGTRTVD